jgi:DNA-binding response OmpR family regulator
LAQSPNVVFTRDRLFEILKPGNYDSFDRAIDIQVARIRKKLGDKAADPSVIKTVRKVGYQFIAPMEKI